MSDADLRKPGEMFTASILKKATPVRQFIFVSLLGFICLFIAKVFLHSQDLIMYAGCFGLTLYIMFNPWLCLLAEDNKKYTITSFILYVVLTCLMYGSIYLLTGKFIDNSWEIRIILITTLFYMVVAYAMMMALKMLFLDQSDGGL